MKRITSFVLTALLLAPLAPLHAAESAQTSSPAERVTVLRWQPHDFAFKANAKVANPFMIACSAEMRST